MKRLIKFLFLSKTLAPEGPGDVGGGAPGAEPNTPAPQPEDGNPAPANKPANTPNPAPANPAPAQPAPQDPAPAWEVNVPEEYKAMLAPAVEKYKALGLTPKQAQVFVDEGVAAVKKSDAQIDAELLSIKTKWGEEFDNRQQAAVKAMAALGFNTQEAAALVGQVGLAVVLERFYEISKKMGPGELKDGDALVEIAGMDAQAANREIERLSADSAFCDKLAANDPEATRRWERLKAVRRGETL